MILENKTAFITGANRGIGKATLELFVRNGCDVIAHSREPYEEFEGTCRQWEKETNQKITHVYFDMTNAAEMKTAIKELQIQKKKIDILVNNAGGIYNSLFQMASIEETKQLFDVNYFAQIQLSQYIVKIMVRNKGGSIINLSSSAAFDCNEGRLAYAATKASMITATKVMAKELGRYGIRVNAVAPGLTDTDMMRGSTDPGVMESVLEQSCMKRIGKPSEIASSIMFLASDLASFITGQVIRVDGGMYHGA